MSRRRNITSLLSQVPIGYDADAVTYFTKLAATGNAPSTFYKNAVNQFVLDLKGIGNVGSNNNWHLLRYWPIFATEYQSHAVIDLINPSRTAAIEINVPTWTQWRGYNSDGATSCLDTGFNPFAEGMSIDDTAHFAYVLTNTALNGCIAGCSDSGNECSIYPKWSDNNIYTYVNSVNSNSLPIADCRGLVGAMRSSTFFSDVVHNNSVILHQSDSHGLIPNVNDYVCCVHGLSTNYFDTRTVACRAWTTAGIDLSSMYAAWQAFATTLGFNV